MADLSALPPRRPRRWSVWGITGVVLGVIEIPVAVVLIVMLAGGALASSDPDGDGAGAVLFLGAAVVGVVALAVLCTLWLAGLSLSIVGLAATHGRCIPATASIILHLLIAGTVLGATVWAGTLAKPPTTVPASAPASRSS